MPLLSSLIRTPFLRTAKSAPVNTIAQLALGVFECEFDADFSSSRFRYHNAQFAEIFGFPRDHVIASASDILRDVPLRNLLRWRSQLLDEKRTGGEQRAEVYLRRGARTLWLEVHAIVHRELGGRIVVSGCCWDISTRKERQREVDRLHERGGRHVRMQSTAMPLAIVVTSFDESRLIREWNAAAEKMFGFTHEEAVGRSVIDLVVPESERASARTRQSGLSEHRSSGWTCRAIRKDGASVWCRWFMTPLYDVDGEIVDLLALVQDVTHEIETEERSRLWNAVIEQSNEATLICDRQQKIVQVNPAFERITGYAAREVLGQSPRILSSGKQSREFYKNMWRNILEKGSWSGEIWNRRKSGELFAEWISLSVLRDKSGEITHYIGTFSDITASKQHEERLHRLSNFDSLTQLPNRSFLVERAGQMLARARRNDDKVALLSINLDRFKNINDSIGYEVGDEVLKCVARRLIALLRESDTIARMGGDHFAVLLEDIRHEADVLKIANAVVTEVKAPISLGDHEFSLTTSIGICIFPDQVSDSGALVRNADAAMFKVKEAGGDAVQVYTRAMNERALESLTLENALRFAIDRNEFELHYQPQIDTRTRKVVGLEALIRWNRPGVGLVMPGQFIALAEERGLIAEIGQWTVDAAARQAAMWNDNTALSVPIAVNISAPHFHRPDFVARVTEALKKSGIHSSRIELEITEGVIVRDCSATLDIMHALRKLGVQLSIDDFGTGYSSLNYLRRFPVHKIKIDQSFIRDMLKDRGATGIVRAIVSMAKCLGLQVIAEGVEEHAQLNALLEYDCEVAQGYLIAKPMAAQLVPSFVERWHLNEVRDLPENVQRVANVG